MKDDWKKLIRELKILRAKKQTGGWLPPKEAKRLEWLEERFGDAPEIERIQIDEPVDAGAKVTTADHGYATEMSEKLLDDAEKYKLTKAWEKDAQRKQRAFEARDRREGEKTFKQEGLSGFAVEASEDLKEGEIGLAEVPREEEESAKKIEHGQVVYAQDESERLTKKTEGTDPFSLNISDGLVRGLDKHKEYDQDTVPDTAAKSFEVEMSDAGSQELDAPSRAQTKADDLSDELQGVLKKSYDLPKDDAQSDGEKTTHEVGDAGEDPSTLDLMRAAVDYAEEQGTTEEEAQVFEIDEEGKAIPYEDQVEDLSAALEQSESEMGDPETEETMEAQIPDPGATQDFPVLVPDSPEAAPNQEPHFSDNAPTLPGVAPSEMSTEMGEALQAPDPTTDPTNLDEDEMEEIDSAEIQEVPVEVEMEIDHSSPAEAAASMETPSSSEDIEADKFWGLAEEATVEPPPAAAKSAVPLFGEPPTMPQQEKPSPPKYRPKKPLPALSVAPGPPSPPKQAKPAPAPKPARPAPARVDKKSTDALLEDVEEQAGVPAGPRKATVHFKDGVTKRGVVGHVDTDADLVRLDPSATSSAPPEDLVALALKTIFLMLPRGAQKPRVNGSSVRLVLIDGRSLEGVTTDYDPQRKAFTLFPKGARGNIERIIVYNDALKNIWFD